MHLNILKSKYFKLCCVPKCPFAHNGKGKTFSFPKDLELRNIWLNKTCNTIPSNNTGVCSLHFNDDDFEQDAMTGMKSLKPNAYPHLNLPPQLKCCIASCPQSLKPSVKIFSFPKNLIMHKMWLARTGFEGDSSNFGVCALHFNLNDYVTNKNTGERHLNPNAVPNRKLIRVKLDCCIGCVNSQKTNDIIFKFPTDPLMRTVWLASVGLTHVPLRTGVCSIHFDHKDFSPNKTLLPEAYPHLNLPPGISVEEIKLNAQIEQDSREEGNINRCRDNLAKTLAMKIKEKIVNPGNTGTTNENTGTTITYVMGPDEPQPGTSSEYFESESTTKQRRASVEIVEDKIPIVDICDSDDESQEDYEKQTDYEGQAGDNCVLYEEQLNFNKLSPLTVNSNETETETATEEGEIEADNGSPYDNLNTLKINMHDENTDIEPHEPFLVVEPATVFNMDRNDLEKQIDCYELEVVQEV